MPSTIEQVHREFKDRGLTVLAINIQEDKAHVAGWVREKKLSFQVLLDPQGTVTAAYQVTGTPTVFIVSREGKLVGKATGTKGWMTDKGKALLETLLAP
ncbi:MAG: TlpA family protein disulfide reductase [Candidatus Rokubacteria bacterium]|nr:TlpA family protein disulfide reductase [Candidatus Rokubacteria bacterium]